MAKSLAIIHLNDSGKVDILHGYREPNSTNILFNMNELCYVAIIGHDNINQTYFLSLFREKISGNYSDPFLKIFLLVSPSFKNDKVCYHIYLNVKKITPDPPLELYNTTQVSSQSIDFEDNVCSRHT